jgi:O-methyltransferase involved in polyketide biosynthesis
MKIDTTQPHIGRIYDYALGGHHNYEVDRQAAEEMLRIMPSYAKWARLNRWFLQLVGQTWADEGRAAVLDIASGLPTQGHFNEYLPQAKLLFSDVDPVSVTYGQQILADKPNMRYVQTDVRQPDDLLREAATFFGVDRRLAVGAVGILYFLSDAEVTRLMRALHAFCAPGSALSCTFLHVPDGPAAQATMAIVQRAAELSRISIYARTPEEMTALLGPWKLREQKNTTEWLEVPDMLSGDDHDLEVRGALADH